MIGIITDSTCDIPSAMLEQYRIKVVPTLVIWGNEQFRDRIDPRGLVPVLVHDGGVHIESNDIIAYLEKTFAQPRLVPEGHENEVGAL